VCAPCGGGGLLPDCGFCSWLSAVQFGGNTACFLYGMFFFLLLHLYQLRKQRIPDGNAPSLFISMNTARDKFIMFAAGNVGESNAWHFTSIFLNSWY
jgi:hypothetical protein